MRTVGFKDARSNLAEILDEVAAGEFVTITRDGRPAAVVVSVEAAEAVQGVKGRQRLSLVEYLKTFPDDLDDGDLAVFERNPLPSRGADL